MPCVNLGNGVPPATITTVKNLGNGVPPATISTTVKNLGNSVPPATITTIVIKTILACVNLGNGVPTATITTIIKTKQLYVYFSLVKVDKGSCLGLSLAGKGGEDWDQS